MGDGPRLLPFLNGSFLHCDRKVGDVREFEMRGVRMRGRDGCVRRLKCVLFFLRMCQRTLFANVERKFLSLCVLTDALSRSDVTNGFLTLRARRARGSFYLTFFLLLFQCFY